MASLRPIIPIVQHEIFSPLIIAKAVIYIASWSVCPPPGDLNRLDTNNRMQFITEDR